MAMDVLSRMKGITLKPKKEWAKINEESLSVSKLFSSYVLFLAFIPATTQFLRFGFVGFKVPYRGWYRFGIGMAFLRAFLVYAFALGLVYLFGLIINALAPAFSCGQNLSRAMNLAAYGLTPLLAGNILYLVPFLRRLDVLVGLYGIYILYLGIMAYHFDAPKNKTVVFFIVSVATAGLLSVVAWVILDTIFMVGRVSRLI
jgi:hypothetical protein